MHFFSLHFISLISALIFIISHHLLLWGLDCSYFSKTLRYIDRLFIWDNSELFLFVCLFLCLFTTSELLNNKFTRCYDFTGSNLASILILDSPRWEKHRFFCFSRNYWYDITLIIPMYHTINQSISRYQYLYNLSIDLHVSNLSVYLSSFYLCLSIICLNIFYYFCI